jgi:polyphosphate kinase 2
MSKTEDDEILALQAELVKAQIWAIEKGLKFALVLEGRDAAGKDGMIRSLTRYTSPRNTRVVALAKPSDRERTQWYFQRYVPHLPAAGEWAIFNRSWYNRAGVEKVMGFSTPEEQEQFLRDVPGFEQMLAHAGVILIKLWLDISKKEQAERLEDRRTDPLKRLKTSPLDAEAQPRWDAYSEARNEMLTRTDTDAAPWYVVRGDDKDKARIAALRLIIQALDCPGRAKGFKGPSAKTLFRFTPAAVADGRLHP